jgi:hypothetical protein
MTDRQPYTYTVLRYRHDPLAGEMINVGVVLHAPKSAFLGTSVRSTYGRLSKLYPDLEGAALTRILKKVQTGLKRISESEKGGIFASSESAQTFAKRIIDDPAGSYVWSDVRSGITKSPELELNRLFQRYIGKFETTTTSRRSDADVWRPARDKLVEREIANLFEKKTIRSNRDEVEFDNAWKNGIWHCLQPLSFDLADVESIQNKAARWVGHIVGLSTSEEDFRPYFIVGKPSDDRLHPAFERAVAFLSEAPSENSPRVVREEEIETFVKELETQIHSH